MYNFFIIVRKFDFEKLQSFKFVLLQVNLTILS